jgi:minor extracellular serine protease Vpr
MARKLAAVVAISALTFAILLPAATLAADGPVKRQFERKSVSKVDVDLLPLMLAKARQVTVMLELGAEPVLARGEQSKGKQKAQAKALETQQAKVANSAENRGATVLGTFQYTYNGVKVRVSAAKLPAMASIPGVVAVRQVKLVELDNVNGVPYVGAPSAWQDAGATGEGVKVAILDSGIDYTHADFGGPGTTAAYEDNDPRVIEPGTFPTAKVIAGWDFVGNEYDPVGGSATPDPDPDPLDCAGHGSHVAGIAAGAGVSADGSTFAGPYDASTVGDPADWIIGPGVAPEASIISLKVFGCEGGSLVVPDALEWVGAYNVDHPSNPIDVVNMSLGAVFGRAIDPSSIATQTLVESGVVVAAAAGNAGANAYITDSPGVATGAISVAAVDALPSFPSASIDMASGPDIAAINENAYPGLPVSGTLDAIGNGTGGLSLGCVASDFAGVAGKIVVVQRGVCAFVDKGANADAAGAIGIVVVNRDDLPPAELPTFLGYNPEIFDIPMIGVGNAAKAALLAADGTSVTLNGGQVIANPAYKNLATFSSGGPRTVDSAAKPDVAAPGVSIISALVGGGTLGTTNSGTSMSTPNAAGIAALVVEANPDWGPTEVKAAIMNTADASSVHIRSYNVRTAGAGVAQANRAVDTLGLATTGPGEASLSYGYEPLGGAYSESKVITLWNTGSSAISYVLAASSPLVTLSASSVSVPAGGSVEVDATAALSAAQVAALPTVDVFLGAPWGGVNSLRGVVTATPTSSGAGIYELRVPYLLVPRGLSNVAPGTRSAYTQAQGIAQATVPLANSGIHTGFGDVYAWGLTDAQDPAVFGSADVRTVGVQTLPAAALGVDAPSDRGLIFAVNSYGMSASGSENEIDIAIDTNNNGKIDYVVVGVDFGAVTTPSFDGRFAAFTFNAAGDVVDIWVADAPANGSTYLLPTLASDLGLKKGNSDFNYWVITQSLQDGSLDVVPGKARFDSHKPAVSTGDFVGLAPGAGASLDLWVDRGKFASAQARGWLVVTMDDANGAAQADQIPVGNLPPRP